MPTFQQRKLLRLWNGTIWCCRTIFGEALDDIICWIKNQHAIREQRALNKIIKQGYRCLFYGPQGTGKTLTATLLGKQNDMDVYRVDLSMIISKYIGETEKRRKKNRLKTEKKKKNMKKTLFKNRRVITVITVYAFICFPHCIRSQNNTYLDDDYTEWTPDTVYVPVHDTTYIYISRLNDITAKLGMSYDLYVRSFLSFVAKRDSNRIFSPQEIYLNYFLPLLEEKPGSPSSKWAEGVFSLYASPDISFMKYSPLPLPNGFQEKDRQMNILFECRGDRNTDYFLQSPQLIDTYLVQFFKYIHEVNSRKAGKIRGINFYFPDFSFKRKRAMAQFAKSISLIADKCGLNTIHSLRVYFSFDSRTASGNEEYLSCIADMTDSIFVFNSQNDHLFSTAKVITRSDADKYWLISKIINQIYLASFYMGHYPSTDKNEFLENNIVSLIHADYPENNWETYALILAGIFLLALATFTLYYTVPEFAYFLSRNKKYTTILILILIFETFLLLFSILEAMSRSSVFDFSNENGYLLPLMPLLLVIIAPILKLSKNRDKP
jgi:DNA polymerase III delta prime subunit